MHKIPGSEGCTIYHLHYIGGPCDGIVCNSFRPYDMMREPDGSLYAADEHGEKCLEWVDDWTRRITLKFRGNMTFEEYLNIESNEKIKLPPSDYFYKRAMDRSAAIKRGEE